MSYIVLWIETAAAFLLITAALLACAARIRRPRWYALAVGLIVLVPLAKLAALTAAAAVLQVQFNLEHHWLAYTLSLLGVCGVGAIWIQKRARRRVDPLTRAGATWPRWPLAISAGIAVTLWAMTLWNMDAAARTQAMNLRVEAGAMAMASVPPRVGDDRNAALVYEQAFALLRADESWQGPNKDDHPLNQDPPEAGTPAAVAFLARHTRAVDLLHQAAGMPECTWEHDYARPGYNMILPELGDARTAARLLRLHALREIETGRIDSAVRDLNAMFQLGQDVAQSPLIISALVGISIDTMAVGTLEKVVAEASAPEQLAAVQIPASEVVARRLRRSLRGEQAFGIASLADLALGQLDWRLLIATGEPETLVPPGAMAIYRIFLFDDDVRAYRSIMEQYELAAAKPYSRAQPDIQQVVQRFEQRRPGLLTAMLAPALNRMFGRSMEAQARLEAARVGVAVARYRMAHGKLPSSLAEVDAQVTADPADGKPLRYRLVDGQALIYSVGENLADDGGDVGDDRRSGKDVVFTVRRPAPTSRPGG